MWASYIRQSKINNSQRGFTIVELLIVIVVIGILAAITIVAYNGIQQRAHNTAAQVDANSVTKLLAMAYANGGAYPADLTTVNNGGPMPSGDGTSYIYHPGSGNASYCATVTNTNISYRVTDTSTSPIAGACPGDGVNGVAAITNLLYNPNLEGNSTVSNWGYFSSPLSVDSTVAAYGIYSLKTVTNSAINPQGLVFAGQGVPAGTYTCSISLAGTPGAAVYVSGRTESPYAEQLGTKTLTLSSAFQRISVTFTLSASVGTIEIQTPLTAPTSGVTIWGDGAMCVSGSTAPNYADGASPNWIWNGAANNSSSTGPA